MAALTPINLLELIRPLPSQLPDNPNLIERELWETPVRRHITAIGNADRIWQNTDAAIQQLSELPIDPQFSSWLEFVRSSLEPQTAGISFFLVDRQASSRAGSIVMTQRRDLLVSTELQLLGFAEITNSIVRAQLAAGRGDLHQAHELLNAAAAHTSTEHLRWLAQDLRQRQRTLSDQTALSEAASQVLRDAVDELFAMSSGPIRLHSNNPLAELSPHSFDAELVGIDRTTQRLQALADRFEAPTSGPLHQIAVVAKDAPQIHATPLDSSAAQSHAAQAPGTVVDAPRPSWVQKLPALDIDLHKVAGTTIENADKAALITLAVLLVALCPELAASMKSAPLADTSAAGTQT